MAKVELSPRASEELLSLPVVIKARIFGIVARLEQWPQVSGAKPMSGPLAGHYRIRTGDYRVLFSVEKGTVLIERIGHRDKFYEG